MPSDDIPEQVYADAARAAILFAFDVEPEASQVDHLARSPLHGAAVASAYAAGLAAASSEWQYGYRINFPPDASIYDDGVSPTEWCESGEDARWAADSRSRQLIGIEVQAEIVRRRPAGPVEVVPASEEQPS